MESAALANCDSENTYSKIQTHSKNRSLTWKLSHQSSIMAGVNLFFRFSVEWCRNSTLSNLHPYPLKVHGHTFRVPVLHKVH